MCVPKRCHKGGLQDAYNSLFLMNTSVNKFKSVLKIFSEYDDVRHEWCMTCNDEIFDGLNPIGYALARNKYDYVEFFLELDGLEQLSATGRSERVRLFRVVVEGISFLLFGFLCLRAFPCNRSDCGSSVRHGC